MINVCSDETSIASDIWLIDKRMAKQVLPLLYLPNLTSSYLEEEEEEEENVWEDDWRRLLMASSFPFCPSS